MELKISTDLCKIEDHSRNSLMRYVSVAKSSIQTILQRFDILLEYQAKPLENVVILKLRDTFSAMLIVLCFPEQTAVIPLIVRCQHEARKPST